MKHARGLLRRRSGVDAACPAPARGMRSRSAAGACEADVSPVSSARRSVLGALSMALVAVLAPRWVRAASGARSEPAFRADTLEMALRELFGTTDIPESDRVRLTITSLAENGAVVPVKLETELAGARSITLLASKNPVPLLARFELGDTTRGFIETRIKLAETSEVLGVVAADEGLFLARRVVEVTTSGCAQ